MIQVTSIGPVMELAEVHSDGSVEQLGELQRWQGVYLYFPDASLVNGGLTFEQLRYIQKTVKALNKKPA